MGQIIKAREEEVKINKTSYFLGYKWEFFIEFANDKFWPYEYKFAREDCYFKDFLEDRGTLQFPLKKKEFDNTEIFLETDDIVVFVWTRWNIYGEEKSFIDIVNIKTEKKQRFITEEVSVIFNMKDKIFVNLEFAWTFKTIILDINSLEVIEEKEEELNAFFKVIYNKNSKKYSLIDFIPNSDSLNEDNFQSGTFSLRDLDLNWTPDKFNRKEFLLDTNWITVWQIDIWEESIK